MITTSSDYKIAIDELSRNTDVKITFGVFDVTAREDATPSANTTHPFTDVLAVVDERVEPDYKVGTFEDDYFKLDGSFVLTPDDPVPDYTEIGWWSEEQSDASGEFTTDPVITLDFVDYHSTLGLGIVFDSIGGNYCKDFTIQWYDGVTLLEEEIITGNILSFLNVETAVSNFNKIVVTLSKTDKPYRYARLMEINFGLQEIFTSDEIVSADLIEESDPVSSEISINRLKFTVLNENQRFNMINPTGVYEFLQRRQPIQAFSGLLVNGSYEYVNMGTYYLNKWENSNKLTATLEATDVIGVLDKTTYYASPYWSNEPFENVLTHILEDANVPFDVSILGSISENITGYIPVISHREAIQMVLIAASCAMRYNRVLALEVFRPNYTTSDKTLDFDTILKDPDIEQKELITTVQANQYVYTLASSATTIYETSFDLTGAEDFIFVYDNPADSPSISVTGGTIVGTPEYSATSVKVEINGAGTVAVTITGKVYSWDKKIVQSVLGSLPAGEVPQIAQLDENPLLTTNTQDVTDYYLDYYQKRILQVVNYNGDPSLQAGDNVDVETIFDGVTKQGVVERQEISLSPSLRAILEVVG